MLSQSIDSLNNSFDSHEISTNKPNIHITMACIGNVSFSIIFIIFPVYGQNYQLINFDNYLNRKGTEGLIPITHVKGVALVSLMSK